jgi:hypothetical protein
LNNYNTPLINNDMKKVLLGLLLSGMTAISFAQKTIYDPNAVARDVKGYHAIKISDGIDLYLTYGDEAVAVSAAEAKYRDKITTVVENGILKIAHDDRGVSWNTNRRLKAYVSYKRLDALAASGGCDVTVDGSIKSNDLIIHISGGSDFKGAVDVENLNIDQSGGSDINITGRAKTVSLEASGGSDFKGYGLITDVCSIAANGGSDVEVTVNKELSAKASGASDITYKGAASVKESKASGASSVSRRS